MTAHQAVIVTVLGAAAGLAGLVLVFLGIVVTTYQSFPGKHSGPLRVPGFGNVTTVMRGMGTVDTAVGLVMVGHRGIAPELTVCGV